MFQLAAMSANLKEANIAPMDRARIDTSISLLADLTGACERIFKSPVPLVYTRHTARFLTTFLVLLPLALWEVTGASWNHWATVPATIVIAFFLFGIEEIGIQIEEPFSILPLEALCNGAFGGRHLAAGPFSFGCVAARFLLMRSLLLRRVNREVPCAAHACWPCVLAI